ncbi:MAG: hypothetical protein U0941_29470 [Planctomycetaceae bacterium]
MTRYLRFACATLLIAVLWGGVAPNIGQTSASDSLEEKAVVARLLRRDYRETQYASFVLEVRCRAESEVRAHFDLRQKSKKLASIPLLPTTQKNADGSQTTLLRVNCVELGEVSDTSFFYVFVSDPQTGKTVKEIRVLLSSAESVERLPGKLESEIKTPD